MRDTLRGAADTLDEFIALEQEEKGGKDVSAAVKESLGSL